MKALFQLLLFSLLIPTVTQAQTSNPESSVFFLTQSAPSGVASEPQAAPMLPSEFISKIHQFNQLEIQLGELAKKKSNTEAVRQFGEQLIKDHRYVESKILPLAQQNKQELKSFALSVQQLGMMNQLETLVGREFDQAITKAIANSQKDLIKTLNLTRETTNDTQLKTLIKQFLPILSKNEEKAADLEQKVGPQTGYA